jgi:uncharacterized protein (DUF927 family)
MTYDYREKIGLLTPSTEHKGYYVCPSCKKNKLEVSDKGAKCWTGGCEPAAIRKAIDELEGKPEQWVKSVREKREKTYSYRGRDGKNLVEITRKDDGDGTKNFQQKHWNGTKWIYKNPTEIKKQIPIYQYAKVQEAIASGQQIRVAEGEETADDLWDLGIPATTTIGGSKGYGTYGDYSQDLIGARLVLCPDRDATGLKYMANFARDFANQIDGYCLAGEIEGWSKPSDGRDLSDDIELFATKESILAKVITVEQFNEIIPSAKQEKPKKPKNPSQFSSSIDKGLTVSVKVGGKEEDIRVANHLKAIANVTTPEGEGVVLEFAHRRGSKICTTILYREDLAGEGLGTLRALARQGYDWNFYQKDTLLEALHQLGRDEIPDAVITNKTGWHGDSYVTAHKTYGDQSIRFGGWEVSPDALTEMVGKLVSWQTGVGAKCAGNSRLTLALALAFLAPLIGLLEGMESGGVHIYGDSSEGKSTSAKVAISVTGEIKLQTWNQTVNGIEGTAEAHNDSLMILDELQQVNDPKKAGKIVYDLANEVGKVRAKMTGDAKKSKTWTVSFLSTGEKSLPDYLKSINITIKAGQEVRMPSIPASPYGSPFGCFETIHGAESAERFAMDLETAAAANRGVAGDAFISRLVVDAQSEDFIAKLSQRIKEVAAEMKAGIENGAVKRIIDKRLAPALAALELAIDYGIVPFSKETAGKSIKKILREWLNDRGGDGSRDVKEAVANFLQVIERNLRTSRVYDPRHPERVLSNTLGYWKPSEDADGSLCIVPQIFEAEFCREVKKSSLVKELIRLGVITPRADGKSTSQQIAEPDQKNKKYYFVVNLESCSKIGDSGDSGDFYAQKTDMETLLADREKGDSAKQKVIPVILSGENLNPESPESPREKKSDSGAIPQNPGLASDSVSKITESPESPKKTASSQKTLEINLSEPSGDEYSLPGDADWDE